jgi:DNA transformation protein
MPGDESFATYVREQLAAFRGVSCRPMFGGFGVYRAGAMFGLIADDELYFKVTDGNRADYEAARSKPFVYQARGKRVALSYWRVPDDVLENPDLLVIWAAKAHVAALAARTGAQARRKGLSPRKQARR